MTFKISIVTSGGENLFSNENQRLKIDIYYHMS